MAWTRTGLAVLTALCVTIIVPVSRAQDRQICARLTAQLSAVSVSRPPTRHYQRYAMNVEYQQRLIERTQNHLMQKGCSAGSVIHYPRGASDCRRLAADLRRMQRDLSAMLRRRDAHAGQGSTTARQRIIEALEANGCEVPVQEVRIRRQFGEQTIRSEPEFDDPSARYRTLCVRVCDGYFFPVSYSVPPASFSADAARCSAMCPGTEARLYVHRIPDEDSPDMVSAADYSPYTALPGAYAYRNGLGGRDISCSCEMSPPARSSLGSTRQPSIMTRSGLSDTGQPGSDQSPETTDEAELRDIDPSRKVRTVGPAFLPEQSGASDLEASPAD